jgi:hypothetical protein
MKKRIFSLVMAVLMLFLFNFSTYAETSVQPRYSYTASISAGLTINSQQAQCTSNVVGYHGTTTRIKTKIILQKKGLFSWSSVTSWSSDVYDYVASYGYHYGPLSGGTYRVKVEATVYAGSASETITSYSSQVKI